MEAGEGRSGDLPTSLAIFELFKWQPVLFYFPSTFIFHLRTPSCVAMPIIATKQKFPAHKSHQKSRQHFDNEHEGYKGYKEKIGEKLPLARKFSIEKICHSWSTKNVFGIAAIKKGITILARLSICSLLTFHPPLSSQPPQVPSFRSWFSFCLSIKSLAN